jgi:hypothetical protein
MRRLSTRRDAVERPSPVAFAILLVIATATFVSGQTVDSATVVVDAGVDGPAARDADPAGARAAWFVGAIVESSRVAMGREWHFSAAAAFRREPTLGMTRDGTRIAAAYLDALAGSVALRFAHTSGSVETAIVGRLAETRVDAGQRVVVAANTIGASTFVADAMVDIRWNRRGRRSSASASPLRAIVDGYVGVKHDQRFHRAGDLSDFDDPTGRLEMGMFIAPWRLVDANGHVLMTAAAGVDGETALRTGRRLPSGVRMWGRAEVDLRQALGRRR